MDPHPSLPYLAHVLDMAETAIAKVPSAGVCVDRQDWIGQINPNADDERTWLPVDGRFVPVRALIHSWKPAMKASRSWVAVMLFADLLLLTIYLARYQLATFPTPVDHLLLRCF